MHEVWQWYQDKQKIGYFAERIIFMWGDVRTLRKVWVRTTVLLKERRTGDWRGGYRICTRILDTTLVDLYKQRQTEFSSVVPCCKRTNCMENAKRWQCGPFPGWSCKRPKLESSKKKAQKRKASHDEAEKKAKNLIKKFTYLFQYFKMSFQISVNIKINAVILNLSCGRTRDSFYTTLYKKYVILSKICKCLEILRRRGGRVMFQITCALIEKCFFEKILTSSLFWKSSGIAFS